MQGHYYRHLLLAWFLSTSCAVAQADAVTVPVYRMIQRVDDRGLVVAGRVKDIQDVLILEVERVFRGQYKAKTLAVTGAWKNTHSEYVTLGENDHVVLLVNQNLDGTYDQIARDAWFVVALPGGVRVPKDEKNAATYTAIEQLVAILGNTDFEKRNQQMLRAATSKNELLRREALAYIGDGGLASSPRPEQFKPALIELLQTSSTVARVSALRALRPVPVDDELDLLF